MSIIEQQINTGLYKDMTKALNEAANAASREGTEELGPKAKETLNNKITSLGEKVFLRKNRDGTYAALFVVKVSNKKDLKEISLAANKEAEEKLEERLKTYAESIEEKSEFKTDKKYEAAREFMDENKCNYFTYLTRSKAGSENGNIEFVEFDIYSLDFAREPEMTPWRMVVSKDPSGTPKTVIAGHHHPQLQWFVNGNIPDDCIQIELSHEQQEAFLERFKQHVEVNDDFSHEWNSVQSGTIKLIINNNEININRVQFLIVDDSGEYTIMGTTHENNGYMLLDHDPNRPMYEVKYCGGTVDLEDLETEEEESP